MRRVAALVLLVSLVLPAFLRAQTPAPVDSTDNFLRRLQREDDAFFDGELLRTDAAFVDSVVAAHEELGFVELQRRNDSTARRFDFDFGPSFDLLTFNRVDGFVAGALAQVDPWGPRNLSLRGQAAWAFASEEPRYEAALRVPLLARGLSARASYRDRVEPFGANRPQWNALRALAGGADEQDYLRRRGGRAGMEWARGRSSVAVAYEAARETGMDVATDFAVINDLSGSNLAIDAGIDRAVAARVVYGEGTLSPFAVRLEHRIAGGALGGDFDYARTDLRLQVRRYVERFEVQTTVDAVRTSGDAPVQRLADVGGLDGVRGYPRRMHVGESSLSVRAEIPVPYDLLRRSRLPLLRNTGVQFVPFVDAARVFDGDAEGWIQSYGLGAQKLLGGFGRAANLRLDIAFPVGPERPDDVLFLLRFAGN